jgi:hypothetical protein
MHSLWFQKPHWRNIYRPFPKLPIKLVKMLGGRQSPEESRAKFMITHRKKTYGRFDRTATTKGWIGLGTWAQARDMDGSIGPKEVKWQRADT